MDLSVIRENEKSAAVVNSQSVLIYDVVSALDFAMSVKCETGCTGIALNKEAVSDEFFGAEYTSGRGNSSEIRKLRYKAGGLRRFFRVCQ